VQLNRDVNANFADDDYNIDYRTRTDTIERLQTLLHYSRRRLYATRVRLLDLVAGPARRPM